MAAAGDEAAAAEVARVTRERLIQWAETLIAAGATPVLVMGLGQVGAHAGQVHIVMVDEASMDRELVRAMLQRALADVRRGESGWRRADGEAGDARV